MKTMQRDLFSIENLSSASPMPAAPRLIAHKWPFPGLSGEDSARSSLAQSAEFAEVVALTIIRANLTVITDAEVKKLLPREWRDLLGPWAHASLAQWQGRFYGIHVEHVGHGVDGGYHWQYRVHADK